MARKNFASGTGLSSERVSEVAARLQQPGATDPQDPDRAPRPKTQAFRRPYAGPRITPEAAARQGRVTQLAWRLLGGREPAIAFLNAHDATLDGRPLDLAVASEEACQAVERAIAQHADTNDRA